MQQYSSLLFIVLMVAAFYFLLLKPQQKRAQQQKDMVGALKPGDEIMTIGGIFATVVEVDERIRVRVLDGTELELAKQAIGQVLPAEEGDADEDAEDADEPVVDEAPVIADAPAPAVDSDGSNQE